MSPILKERREKTRFPIRREMRYKLLRDGAASHSGTGTTINIGSAGVAFTADETLSRGCPIEVSISWPALLNKICPMRLTVFGRVLRSSGGVCACTVDRYEFRTQASQPLPSNGVRSDSTPRRWAR